MQEVGQLEMGVYTIKSTKGCTSDGKMSGERSVHTTGKGLQREWLSYQ